MNDNNNIEKLFKDKFDNFEPNVDASVWNGVEHGIKIIPGTPAPVVVKSFSVLKSVIAVVSVATIAFVSYSVFRTKSPEAINTPVLKSETILKKSNLNSGNNKESDPSEKALVSTKNSKPEKVSEHKKTIDENTSGVSKANTLTSGIHQSSSSDNFSNASGQAEQTNAQKQSVTSSYADHVLKPTEEQAKENLPEATELPENSVSPPPVRCELNLSSNTFTPNGDELNDVYFIRDENLKEIHVKIIDMHGKIVKQWDERGGFWDGKLPNGNYAESGNYGLIVNAVCLEGSTFSKKMYIRLNRP